MSLSLLEKLDVSDTTHISSVMLSHFNSLVNLKELEVCLGDVTDVTNLKIQYKIKHIYG